MIALNAYLLDGYFVDASLMTTTLVGGCQEGLDHSDSLIAGDKTTWHCDDVGIVVLTSQACYSQAPAECRTNALMLVKGDVNALSTSTHGNAGIAFATLYGQCTGMGKVGIVATILAVSAKVLACDTLPLEPLLNSFLDRITGMVAAKGDRQTGF